MQSILISKCKKGFARHTSQELRGRATGGWRPSSRLPASRRGHAALVVSRRRLHRMVVAPRSSGVRKRETVREQRIALLCHDSSPAGGPVAVVAHPKQLCRFRIPTHGIAADRRIVVRHEEIEGSPASFGARAISSAVLRASSVTVARSSDGISTHPYGAMGSVRPSEKNKNPRCRSTGGS